MKLFQNKINFQDMEVKNAQKILNSIYYLHKVPYFSNELAMDRAYIFLAHSNLMLIKNCAWNIK